MEQLNVVLHEDRVNGFNPFGIQVEGPLQNQATVGKREPKYQGSTDVSGFGSRTGGGDFG
ncbi:hypothetical protein EC912_10531 [Luteibacter rhizovicinus]|uniref:Uncharacterized protein n=2 Tax=Luteibacter rhizovicinus TaxID=242606 RepID=A0A4R3YLR7_9GAMM|nr:hypothetical protein EC912_10531 [Luteibacter rhizovicinus]